MTTYGVLTDIHGNREALDACLAALDDRGARRLLSMGDLVGFNAAPDDVVRRLDERGVTAIAGNHDLIAIGALDVDRCHYRAAYALRRTRRDLAPETALYLASLPRHALIDGRILLIHGDLGDPQRYLVSDADILSCARRVKERFPMVRLVLRGHDHEPRVHRVRGSSVVSDRASFVRCDDPDEIVFVNPGSVDAQRKPEAGRRAYFGLLDAERLSVELLHISYDHELTERAARRGGYRTGPVEDARHALGRAARRGAAAAMKLLRDGAVSRDPPGGRA